MKFLNKRWKVIFWVIAGAIIMILGGFYSYTLDYYKALPSVLDTLSEESIKYTVVENMIIFNPKDKESDKGIIFYPGGKVEYTAYIPLMKQIAQEGYNCFLMKMPLNLAVLKQDAADIPIEEYRDIDSWYMAGHSLGGAMASVYTSKHLDEIDGLILLGAYPAADLSGSNIGMISIYGSEDKVLNKEKVEQNKAIGPSDSTYFEIKGGNHAYYGNYGEQDKDGVASISEAEQQAITVREIVKFIELQSTPLM